MYDYALVENNKIKNESGCEISQSKKNKIVDEFITKDEFCREIFKIEGDEYDVIYVPMGDSDEGVVLMRSIKNDSEDKLSDYNESINISLDSTNRVQFVTENFYEKTGLDENNVLNKHITEISVKDDVEEKIDEIFSAETDEERFKLYIKNNELFIFDVLGSNIEESDEKVLLLRDITELEKNRIKMKRRNERLSNLSHKISHDLQNPLNVAMGFLDHARETGKEDSFERVQSAHERMNTLIKQTLKLAETGRIVEEKKKISIKEIAERAKNNIVMSNETTITVNGDIQMEGCPGRTEQIFENLYKNAIEHNDEPLEITVGIIDPFHTSTRVETKKPKGFYVEDNGSGIPDYKKDDVFESGYTTSDDGTGFGLPIIKQIVESHDWSINLTDGRDGGAKFEITNEREDEEIFIES